MTDEQKEILKVYFEKNLDCFDTSAESYDVKHLPEYDVVYQVLREALNVPSFKDWVISNYELEKISGDIENIYYKFKNTLIRIFIEDNIDEDNLSNIMITLKDDKLTQSMLLNSLPEEDRVFTHLPAMVRKDIRYDKTLYKKFYDYFINKEIREEYKQCYIDRLIKYIKNEILKVINY